MSGRPAKARSRIRAPRGKRISSPISSALLVLLAGCAEEAEHLVPAPGSEIACALDGAEAFRPICALDRVGDALVLRHPDGGFRRLDEASLAARDGASAARLQPEPGFVAVTIEDDRYRLPAGGADD